MGKKHYAKVCRQKYTNNRTIKRLTKKTDDRDEASSESGESIHHIKDIEKLEKRTNIYGNSENKRVKEGHRYGITHNNNAAGRKDTEINWITENHKQIPRGEQERSKIPKKISGRCGIREKETKNGKCDNGRNRYNTSTRDGLGDEIQTQQPIRTRESILQIS